MKPIQNAQEKTENQFILNSSFESQDLSVSKALNSSIILFNISFFKASVKWAFYVVVVVIYNQKVQMGMDIISVYIFELVKFYYVHLAPNA